MKKKVIKKVGLKYDTMNPDLKGACVELQSEMLSASIALEIDDFFRTSSGEMKKAFVAGWGLHQKLFNGIHEISDEVYGKTS